MTENDAIGEAVSRALRQLADTDGRLRLDPETAERDLARLVLALVEFLRQLMELQAVRRMEAGSITDDEAEAVGLTLMRSAEAVRKLAEGFGLSEADLALDLGPLGTLT